MPFAIPQYNPNPHPEVRLQDCPNEGAVQTELLQGRFKHCELFEHLSPAKPTYVQIPLIQRSGSPAVALPWQLASPEQEEPTLSIAHLPPTHQSPDAQQLGVPEEFTEQL